MKEDTEGCVARQLRCIYGHVLRHVKLLQETVERRLEGRLLKTLHDVMKGKYHIALFRRATEDREA